MKFKNEDLLVYAITDDVRRSEEEWEKILIPMFEAGIKILQLREKHASRDEFVSLARKLAEICHEHGAKLIVNDDASTCIEAGADGVHLGQGDMPITDARRLLGDDYIIGATAHNLAEAKKAEDEGADYVGLRFKFQTRCKADRAR